MNRDVYSWINIKLENLHTVVQSKINLKQTQISPTTDTTTGYVICVK